MEHEPLTYGHFFHIYNRGNNRCDLYQEQENYEHFLGLYDKYISPVADTYAWVLMPNHFHLLVRIKDEEDIGYIPSKPLSGIETAERARKKYKPEKQFSHLFNSYAQSINNRFGRTGSLVEHPFKRKQIEDEKYLKAVILYIHNNPVHHDFCSHPVEYPWSSYLSCVSIKPTKLKRESVLGWFDSEANFKHLHNEKVEITQIEKWLEM